MRGPRIANTAAQPLRIANFTNREGKLMRTFTAAMCALALAVSLSAQTDPGPRKSSPISGQPVEGLDASELQMFETGRDTFNEVYDVARGLGPRFNMDSCAGCHSHPVGGGSSPAVNPQIAVANSLGAANRIPPFIQPDGPVRVVRTRRGPGPNPGPSGPPVPGTPGGVENLFVISGRSDAPAGCQIRQPDFAANANNLVFRIPTPIFGLGLVEAIPDAALRANLAANGARKRQLGIQGSFNTSSNDGTITRFGWKAQNKSLLTFAGEASNVEMGLTNEAFPQEREDDPACASQAAPEDHENLASGMPSDVQTMAIFMRYLAAPQSSAGGKSVDNGRVLFDQTGCALCHTPSLRSGNSFAALSRQDVNLYSDLALHRMGQALNDGITQGNAQGDEWRTAPLWGLGDRIFLLHDGRTRDLLQAILLHDSQGSEAHNVIANFQALTADQKQDLLNFLRSL
jgi:CxxC motif-containing protein (DUF1111 family)